MYSIAPCLNFLHKPPCLFETCPPKRHCRKENMTIDYHGWQSNSKSLRWPTSWPASMQSNKWPLVCNIMWSSLYTKRSYISRHVRALLKKNSSIFNRRSLCEDWGLRRDVCFSPVKILQKHDINPFFELLLCLRYAAYCGHFQLHKPFEMSADCIGDCLILPILKIVV